MRRIWLGAVVMFATWASAALVPTTSFAAQHLWLISQVFSDATGTVQFIEFVGRNRDQHRFLTGGPHRLITGSGNTFTFDMDLPSSDTQGAHFLVATEGFTRLPGAIAPDFVVPDGFLSLAGDSITFLPTRPKPEVLMAVVLPLDGRSISRQRTPSMDTDVEGVDAGPLLAPDGTPVPNLARNFAGQSFVVSDLDFDGVVDSRDNCPNALNRSQSDVGGVARPGSPQGNVPDGIGDACQCGDVNDDGRVTQVDATLIVRATLNLGPFPSVELLPGFLKCDVVDAGQCTVADATVIQRTTFGLPTGFDGMLCTAFSAN